MAKNDGEGKGTGAPPAGENKDEKKGTKQPIKAELAPNLVKGIKASGHIPSQIMRDGGAVKFYKDLDLWRCTMSTGARIEVRGKTGEWLNDPKKLRAAKAAADKKRKEKEDKAANA